MTRKQYTEKEALERASLICAGSEHCKGQIRGKLAAWGLTEAAQGRVLARLVKEGFINEARFARAYALDKFRYNGWGRVKIDLYLRQLGVQESDRTSGLAAIPELEYLNTLKELLRAKRNAVNASSEYELRGKLIRFALGRGFTMDETIRCLPDDLA